jgi:hypothetical protein
MTTPEDRERESRATDETKFEQLHREEEAQREAAEADLEPAETDRPRPTASERG